MTQDGSPQQIATAETLTRGDAIRAACEWANRLRFELANKAAWRESENESRSFAAAQNAMSTLTELPPDSKFPGEAEKRWRLRVQLHATATGLSYEQADANLREDFKRYVKLLNDVLAAWQQQDFIGHCIRPLVEAMKFSYFWCNECGMNPEELFKHLKDLHTKLCLYNKGERHQGRGNTALTPFLDILV